MPRQDDERLTLKLFVNGNSGRSRQAASNLTALLQEHLPDVCDLEVVDISENVEALEREHILATPTLIKSSPPPGARMVGDLSNSDAVLAEIKAN